MMLVKQQQIQVESNDIRLFNNLCFYFFNRRRSFEVLK